MVIFFRFQLRTQRGVFLDRRTFAVVAIYPGHFRHKKERGR